MPINSIWVLLHQRYCDYFQSPAILSARLPVLLSQQLDMPLLNLIIIINQPSHLISQILIQIIRFILEVMSNQFDGDDFKIALDQNPHSDSMRAKQQNYPAPHNNPQLNQSDYAPPNSVPTVPDSSNYDLSKAAHPIACIATFIFKVIGVVIYMILANYLPSVLTFILVTIFGALDFWTVKNITGRLLVGLRWWSDYDQKGNEIWKFESHDRQISNIVDKAFFWTSQIGATLFWAILLLIKILTISPFWAFLVLINFCASGVNLYGYYKCRGEYSKKLKNLQTEGLRRIAGKLF